MPKFVEEILEILEMLELNEEFMEFEFPELSDEEFDLNILTSEAR